MKKRSGFTLIELLVVVAIIALLIALILPTLARAKEEARLVKCQANLHAIGIAMQTYNNQNQDLMPQSLEYHIPGYSGGTNNNPVDPETGLKFGNLNLSWCEALYIDGDLKVNTNFGGKLNNNASQHYFAVGWFIFQCPKHSRDYQWDTGSPPQPSDSLSQQGYGMAWCATSDLTWKPNAAGTILKYRLALPVHARNLNANHIVCAEAWEPMGRCGGYRPVPSQNLSYGVWSRHMRNNILGGNFLMADGHVEYSQNYDDVPSPLSFNNDYSTAGDRTAAAKYGHPWTHGVAANK